MRAFTLAIAAALALCQGAQAQGTYPDKPVRIIVDSAPGSATDVAVRLMAERLSAVWGQQTVVDNRPGGGGSIAARAGQTATPDGYTLYVGAASTFIAVKGAPGVAPNLPIELPRLHGHRLHHRAADVHRGGAAARRQVAARADRARKKQARRAELRHHGARSHH